jgi:CRISPR/Cas system CSM-associated protein Csm3 (group 7 of RAMP superfamily)
VTAAPDDVGAGLQPVARWAITARLELVTAAHLGGESDSTADMAVIRDRVTGRPLLTGASLGGAMRNYLTDRLDGYLANESDPRVARLFGARRPVGTATHDDEGSQSPLVVFDALGDLAGGPTEIRDGVAINAASGTAEDHKKFDFEVLPAETLFNIRVELLILARDDEQEQLSSLVCTLDGLAQGEITLGARRSRGLGRLRATSWNTRRYDLSNPEGWLDWLTTSAGAPLPGRPGPDAADNPAGACQRAHQALSVVPIPPNENCVTIAVTAYLRGEILVRSPATIADAPDVSHLTSGGRSVIPGTSVAGALRHRALRIVRAVGGDTERTAALVDALFGPAVPTGGSSRRNNAARASRLRVTEDAISGGTRVRSSRIRIDRVTQGVTSTALFDEEPHTRGRLQITLELRNPEKGEVGLLLLLLKDLLAGDLPLGGSASVGRGVLHGQAVLSRPGGTTVTLLVGPDGTGRADPAEEHKFVDEEIDDLKARMAERSAS